MRLIGEEELAHAARVLVTTALRVSRGERFVAVGDVESVPILTALDAAAREAGAESAMLRLDVLRSYSTNHTGERPHKVLPDAVRRAMLSAQASAFVASQLRGESSMREQLLHVVGACRIRHAHMAGITPTAFAVGLAMDHAELTEKGRVVARRLEAAREITCTSDAGTDLVFRTTRSTRWVERLGRVEPGEAVAFPVGSIAAHPESISGTFVATASLGEFFGARETLLRDPVLFEIVGGAVKNVECQGNAQLVREIESILRVAPNSDRVGLVSIGVNAGVREPVGDASVDRNVPGLHLVFGDPMTRGISTGWSARTSFEACQARCQVKLDGTVLIDDARVLG